MHTVPSLEASDKSLETAGSDFSALMLSDSVSIKHAAEVSLMLHICCFRKDAILLGLLGLAI